MAQKKKYACKTCGETTIGHGHLCSPVLVDQSAECQYCGIIVGNPRHVCKPKIKKMQYACDACGRTAVKKSELCAPVKIK